MEGIGNYVLVDLGLGSNYVSLPTFFHYISWAVISMLFVPVIDKLSFKD